MNFRAAITITSALFAFGAVQATADPGNAKGKKPGVERNAADRAYTRLGDYEREILRDYYGSEENCPPGLARKNNGCLPPGIAKKRYEVGKRLGDDVIVIDLPYGLESRLPRLPGGHGYRLIDGDLGVVELATLVVLDAIGLN
jgi:hypothetical protein